MSQLYARVFIQILDSSIAENYQVRHTFEDFLKLVEYTTGTVDVTREAMARRLNMPLEVLNEHIQILESPDTKSRDQEFEGRRLERLNEHRDWGWRILNWEKYDSLRNKADVAERVARHRKKKKDENTQAPPKPQKPTLDEIKLQAAKIGLPESEAEKFFNYYESNGWRVGRNPMKSWIHALTNWKNNNHGNNSKNHPQRVDRSIGTANEGVAAQYRGLGKVVGT